MQAGVIQSQARLRDARTAVLASRDIARAGAAPISDRATLARYGEALAEAECAVTEYRDAGPQFAFVLAQFPAANDDIGNDLAEPARMRSHDVSPLKTEL